MFFDDQCTVCAFFISPIDCENVVGGCLVKSINQTSYLNRTHVVILSPALFLFKATLPHVAHRPFVRLYHVISPLLKNNPKLFC